MIRKYEKPEIRPAELFLEGFICSSVLFETVVFVDEYETFDEEEVTF